MQDQDHQLHPGFYFNPSDELLVNLYLRQRIIDGSSSAPDYLIKEFDIYSTEPWNLPCNSFRYQDEDKSMLFFTPRRPTSRKSKRADRTAGIGFWDGNAKDKAIKIYSNVIGHKTSLNFKIIKGDEKIKTEWIMHEYRLSRSSSIIAFDDLVLCRIYEKKKKSKIDDGQKRSRGQEEAAAAEQSLSKRRHVEEEEPALLPSTSSSVLWDLILEGVQLAVDEGLCLEEAQLIADEGLYLEEAPLVVGDRISLDEALLVADDGPFLASVDWDGRQLSLENFLNDLDISNNL